METASQFPARSVLIPEWIRQVLFLHALDEAPLECCGLLAGRPVVDEPNEKKQQPRYLVEAIFPLDNEAKSATAFYAARGLFAPFKQMRAEGRQLVAIYHSHPATPPVPSQRDLAQNFYPDALHAIISLADDTPQLRLYHLTEDSFHQVPFHFCTEPGPEDVDWLKLTVQLSRQCPKSDRSFAVGALIVDRSGQLVSTGYSLQLGAGWHAEQVALEKARRSNHDIAGGAIYTSMEPCSIRLSGRTPCTKRIIESGLKKVVFALSEPPVFVNCDGRTRLTDAGLNVVQYPEVGHMVEEVNSHVLR